MLPRGSKLGSLIRAFKTAKTRRIVARATDRALSTNIADGKIGNTRQLLCRIAGFHSRDIPSLLEEPFAERFDENTAALLVDDLGETCSNETTRNYLQDLMRYLARSGGVVHVWFDRFLKDLARNIAPSRRKPFPISGSQISERAAKHMAGALADLANDGGRTRAYNAPERFRNGYVLYFLSRRPLRLLNLSQLNTGETFFDSGHVFEIRFPGDMMKNGDPYSSVIDDQEHEFVHWTRMYLDHVLPFFPRGDGLLRSRQGGNLTPIGLYQIIIEATQDILGVRLTPHDFRRVFTDTAVLNGKSLADINHACQRRPGSETVYNYKAVYSRNAQAVVRPMLGIDLATLLRGRRA